MRRFMSLALLIAIVALCSAAETSGRPPRGPLKRVEPKVYDVTVDVQLVTSLNRSDVLGRGLYNLEDAPIVFPIIFRNTFSRVKTDSLRARLWLGSHEDLTLPERTRIDKGFPFATSLAVMPVAKYQGPEVRWKLEFRTQVWSSEIDDAAAASIPWPKEWPDDVRDGLRPQRYIESDALIFAQAVKDASNGQLRFVPPYLAAKDLVRYCVDKISVRGDGLNMGLNETLRALEMKGALQTVKDGHGSAHDVVCVCIATLRAAGIPARPVIGFRLKPNDPKYRSEMLSWGEFYLPDAGWIPFDPVSVRNNGAMHRARHGRISAISSISTGAFRSRSTSSRRPPCSHRSARRSGAGIRGRAAIRPPNRS